MEKKLRIVKRGIEKKVRNTEESLKGYVVEKYGFRLMIIDEPAFSDDRHQVVVGVFESCVQLLMATFPIFEGESVTWGAIVDDNGVEQKHIIITKFL